MPHDPEGGGEEGRLGAFLARGIDIVPGQCAQVLPEPAVEAVSQGGPEKGAERPAEHEAEGPSDYFPPPAHSEILGAAAGCFD